MTKLSEQDALRLLGVSPEEADADLQNFSKSAEMILSSDHPRLIDKYENQWIAVYDGKVATSAEELDTVLGQLQRQNIPSSKAIIQFIERNKQVLIL